MIAAWPALVLPAHFSPNAAAPEELSLALFSITQFLTFFLTFVTT